VSQLQHNERPYYIILILYYYFEEWVVYWCHIRDEVSLIPINDDFLLSRVEYFLFNWRLQQLLAASRQPNYTGVAWISIYISVWCTLNLESWSFFNRRSWNWDFLHMSNYTFNLTSTVVDSSSVGQVRTGRLNAAPRRHKLDVLTSCGGSGSTWPVSSARCNESRMRLHWTSGVVLVWQFPLNYVAGSRASQWWRIQ
jgi:hypothetical protein